jgi:hypothetical protein
MRRRLRLWGNEGVRLDVWRKFLADPDDKSLLDWEEAFIDSSFAPAKKRAKVFLREVPLPLHPRTK